jgi:general nucleoside transport system permease protein
MTLFGDFLQASVRTATPLLFAALGEMVVERSGLINVGLEGVMIAGAFAALAAASHGGPLTGYFAAVAAGLSMGAVFALFTLYLRANQIIAGTALTLLGLGITGTMFRATFGVPGAEVSVAPAGNASELLAGLPVIGHAVFAQPAITYVLYALIPCTWFVMYHMHAGLALRAVGENPEAAVVAGIRPRRVRFLAVLFGGAMGGLAGGTLVLVQVGSFAEGMSAGRGFIAIAIVALGRWHPLGVALAALLFGAATALQFLLQAMGWPLPYQLFLIIPYALTLATLATTRGQSNAPAAMSGGDFAR